MPSPVPHDLRVFELMGEYAWIKIQELHINYILHWSKDRVISATLIPTQEYNYILLHSLY